MGNGQALVEVGKLVVDFDGLSASAVGSETHVKRDGVALGDRKGFGVVKLGVGHLGIFPLRYAGRNLPVVVILRRQLAGGRVQHGHGRVAGGVRDLVLRGYIEKGV